MSAVLGKCAGTDARTLTKSHRIQQRCAQQSASQHLPLEPIINARTSFTMNGDIVGRTRGCTAKTSDICVKVGGENCQGARSWEEVKVARSRGKVRRDGREVGGDFFSILPYLIRHCANLDSLVGGVCGLPGGWAALAFAEQACLNSRTPLHSTPCTKNRKRRGSRR